MSQTTLSISERAEIEKVFGVAIEALNLEQFKDIKRTLNAKYHPDKFEKYEDEVVKAMATDMFQKIESLSVKIENYLSDDAGDGPGEAASEWMQNGAQYAGKKMKVELITASKDLKYHLFGTSYKWLTYGEKFKIPETGAYIIIDEDHRGSKIGFKETIRMYLTFTTEDSIDDIVDWLFGKIEADASKVIVAGQVAPFSASGIADVMKQLSYLRLGPNTED
jgi:hypothetical protein